jgi:hypothetical protein
MCPLEFAKLRPQARPRRAQLQNPIEVQERCLEHADRRFEMFARQLMVTLPSLKLAQQFVSVGNNNLFTDRITASNASKSSCPADRDHLVAS